MTAEAVRVTCYSGQAYAERPVSFRWQGETHQVAKIEREWREPRERHFLVRTEDERLFELCYQEQQDMWSAVELIKGV
jgi:hypothetical protein